MNFREYQLRAKTTDQYPEVNWGDDSPPNEPQKQNIIPLLGLVGEVGELLSEYKKMLRDGSLHEQFTARVATELGDILWYVATVATKFNLDLDQIAKNNITKTEGRWHEPGKRKPIYDENLPTNQQLPRTFSYTFSHREVKGENRLVLTDNKTKNDLGAALKDNAYEDDGYRFHDIMHLAFAVHLGWSPVWRKLLVDQKQIIKRTPAAVDDAEDGGRPQVIDEGLVHAAYVYADAHNFLEGVKAVDWHLLNHCKQMTAKLEVRSRSEWEWNKALIEGFKVWRKLRQHNGGIVEGDLINGTLIYKIPTS